MRGDPHGNSSKVDPSTPVAVLPTHPVGKARSIGDVRRLMILRFETAVALTRRLSVVTGSVGNPDQALSLGSELEPCVWWWTDGISERCRIAQIPESAVGYAIQPGRRWP